MDPEGGQRGEAAARRARLPLTRGTAFRQGPRPSGACDSHDPRLSA